MKNPSQHFFGSAALANTRIRRAHLYLERVENCLQAGDPIHGLSMAAELAEIARRICNDFQKLIDAQSPPKSEK